MEEEKMSIPNMILIGATLRNSGKTELAVRLISFFLEQKKRVTALKVTTVLPETAGCPRGGKGCGVCTSFSGDFLLTEENSSDISKDTGRLKQAGADPVFWLRVKKEKIALGMAAFLQKIGPGSVLICESNSLRTAVKPGVFLITKPEGTVKIKTSCKAVLPYADRVLEFKNFAFDFDYSYLSFEKNRIVLKK